MLKAGVLDHRELVAEIIVGIFVLVLILIFLYMGILAFSDSQNGWQQLLNSCLVGATVLGANLGHMPHEAGKIGERIKKMHLESYFAMNQGGSIPTVLLETVIDETLASKVILRFCVL